jgi:hypothetical protein
MATFSQVGPGAVFIPRTTQKALDQEAIERFLGRAARLGIQAKPLGLKALGGGLLGFLHGADTYRVSWQKEVRITIPGILSFTLALPQQGVFTRYSADQVLMSIEAEALRHPLSTLWEIQETAVLAEEVDPILAVKVAGRWFEVYRWLKRPYLLSDEEAQHLARVVRTG